MPGRVRQNYSLGQKGTRQIAVSRVAAAPQGRSHLRRAQAKFAPSPRQRLCLPLSRLPAATTISTSALWCPTTHPHLQVALSVQKGLREETVTPSYQLSENQCYLGKNLFLSRGFYQNTLYPQLGKSYEFCNNAMN